MRRDGRLGVGIIGAGRVGPVIGAALAGAGHALVGITQRVGRRAGRGDAARACRVLDALEVVRRSELVVIAVPHDELAGLVSGLAELGAWQPGQLVLHTDPAFGTDVLAPAAAQGRDPARRASRDRLHRHLDRSAAAGPRLRRRHRARRRCCRSRRRSPSSWAASRSSSPRSDRAAYAEAHRDGDRVLALDRAPGRRPAARRRACPNPGRYLSALVHSTIDHALADAGSPAAGRTPRYDRRMISTIDGLRTRLAEARAAAPDGARIALISTIGALHDGHIDLVHRAREVADIVVVSIFVNPLRFANATSSRLSPHPRGGRAPARVPRRRRRVRADAAELLPHGSNTTKVTAGDLGLRYEGRSRPVLLRRPAHGRGEAVQPSPMPIYGSRRAGSWQRIFACRADDPRPVRDGVLRRRCSCTSIDALGRCSSACRADARSTRRLSPRRRCSPAARDARGSRKRICCVVDAHCIDTGTRRSPHGRSFMRAARTETSGGPGIRRSSRSRAPGSARSSPCIRAQPWRGTSVDRTKAEISMASLGIGGPTASSSGKGGVILADGRPDAPVPHATVRLARARARRLGPARRCTQVGTRCSRSLSASTSTPTICDDARSARLSMTPATLVTTVAGAKPS